MRNLDQFYILNTKILIAKQIQTFLIKTVLTFIEEELEDLSPDQDIGAEILYEYLMENLINEIDIYEKEIKDLGV